MTKKTPKPTGEPETISPESLSMLQNAQAGLLAAQATLNFVSSNIVQRYNLGPMDQLDLRTGIIARGTHQPVPQAQEAPQAGTR